MSPKARKSAGILGVLYDLKMKAPRFEVVVGETFFQMPYDAKKGFVDTVNCWVREASSDQTMLLLR